MLGACKAFLSLTDVGEMSTQLSLCPQAPKSWAWYLFKVIWACQLIHWVNLPEGILNMEQFTEHVQAVYDHGGT